MTDENERPPADDFDARLKKAMAARDEGGRGGQRSTPKEFSGLGVAFRVGVELASTLAVGTALGYFLDRWLGTLPWLLILFFFLGGAAGVLNVFRLARRMERAGEAAAEDHEGQGSR
jgi:ATP synthase protein I